MTGSQALMPSLIQRFSMKSNNGSQSINAAAAGIFWSRGQDKLRTNQE